VIVVVAGMQWWRYGNLQAEGVQLDEQVAALEREKAELAQAQAQHETFLQRNVLLEARIAIIEQLKAQQSGPVILLNAVASAVSATDSLWLTTLQKTGDRISVEGVAVSMRAVADFMTRLQNSNTFSTVDLRETAQETTADSPNFTFTVEAQIAPPPKPPAQANAA